jgi:hypothetical protein
MIIGKDFTQSGIRALHEPISNSELMSKLAELSVRPPVTAAQMAARKPKQD